MTTPVVHKMGGDLTAVCGAESWELAISSRNVTCPECLAAIEAA